MSGEYIPRAAALTAYCEARCGDTRDEAICRCDNPILSIPAADVAPVRHGRWIQKGRKIYCSNCNCGVYIGTDDEGLMQDEMRLRHFCSACGAKMDGGQDDV